MQMFNIIRKGLAIVLTLAIVLSVFAITASATTVSSAYDSDFIAIMNDSYDKPLRFGSGDIGLANYDIVAQGRDWSNAYYNTRYNYIQYSSGKEVEIVSKEGFTAPGFTLKWEIFTTTAESGTSEMSFGDLRFITNYGEKALYLMLGESELGRFDTGCTDATDFANKYCYNEYTITYIDGVITVTRLINAKGETTATNTPITWTLPGGITSTEIQLPVGVGFADAKITWKSSSEIGKTVAGQIPAPFISQYNGNFPTLSNVRLSRNIGFTTLQKYADFVDGLAANLYRADVAKARTIYDAIAASSASGLVSEVAPLLTLIEAAEQNLPEDGGDPETPHVHTYIPETSDATCTQPGSTTYTCECGHSYVVDGEPLGHDYVGTEIKPATCYEQGEMAYACSRCDASYTETTAVLEHEYTDGYCGLCGDREVYTPDGAEWSMVFVDADGNEIDTVSTANNEFWMVVRLTNYADYIGEMNNTGDLATSTYDRTIASVVSVISMDNAEVIAVRENNKIVYATPYETATLSINYDSTDGLLKSIFYSDDNAGCTFSIGMNALHANNGELFRIKVKSQLVEAGEIGIQLVENTAHGFFDCRC